MNLILEFATIVLFLIFIVFFVFGFAVRAIYFFYVAGSKAFDFIMTWRPKKKKSNEQPERIKPKEGDVIRVENVHRKKSMTIDELNKMIQLLDDEGLENGFEEMEGEENETVKSSNG